MNVGHSVYYPYGFSLPHVKDILGSFSLLFLKLNRQSKMAHSREKWTQFGPRWYIMRMAAIVIAVYRGHGVVCLHIDP